LIFIDGTIQPLFYGNRIRDGAQMANYEARIRTRFGELVIRFENREELAQKLKEAQDLAKDIEAQLAEFIAVEAAKPIVGFEDLYAILSDGSIKLLRFPETKTDVIRLLLFFSPKPLTTDEIRFMTGIDNPLANMKANDFIELPGGTYTISPEGRTIVTSKIIPQLRGLSR